MSNEFHQKNLVEWRRRQEVFFGTAVPENAEWRSSSDIAKVLREFCGPNLNHMFYPTDGGLDLETARLSREDGCIELATDDRVADIVKPKFLRFESFKGHPSHSYFYVETCELERSGLYDDDNVREEVVEIPPYGYFPRCTWDDDEWDNPGTGETEDLPGDSRLIIRWLKGRFVITAKRSVYNLISRHYDARHNKMSVSEFRSYMKLLVDEFGEEYEDSVDTIKRIRIAPFDE